MKPLLTILLLLSLLLSFCACTSPPSSDTDASEPSVEAERENLLILDERRYTYTGEEGGIAVEDDVLTIQKAGIYRISGHLKEGAICVRVSPADMVRLILADVSVTSSYHTPLRVESAACVTLELATDSVNTFTDAAREKEGEEEVLPLSCVEVYGNLIIRGEGTLAIRGRARGALASSGTVRIESGQLTLSSPETGIWVRDRFLLENGSVTVSSAQYGIVVSDDVAAIGSLEITGGHLGAVCTAVALSAGKGMEIIGGLGSLRAPVLYRCERQSDGQTIRGVLRITSPDFPSEK